MSYSVDFQIFRTLMNITKLVLKQLIAPNIVNNIVMYLKIHTNELDKPYIIITICLIITYLISYSLRWCDYEKFSHMVRWLCLCLISCSLTSQRSFAKWRNLWQRPRSNPTCWCCSRESLTAMRTTSCTGLVNSFH